MNTQTRIIQTEVTGCCTESDRCPYLGNRDSGLKYVCYHSEVPIEFEPLKGFPDFCPLPLKEKLKPSKVDWEK